MPLLAHFFEKHGATEQFRLLPPGSLEDLHGYDWPGNVRELENLVERIVTLADSLPVEEILRETLGTVRGPAPAPAESGASYTALMEAKEREIIMKAMEQAGENVAAAARLLDLPRSTLRSKLEKWQKDAGAV